MCLANFGDVNKNVGIKGKCKYVDNENVIKIIKLQNHYNDESVCGNRL